MINVKRTTEKLENMEVGETFIHGGIYIKTSLEARNRMAVCLNLETGQTRKLSFDQRFRIVDLDLIIKEEN